MNTKNEAFESLPASELDFMRSIWEIGEPTTAANIHKVLQKYRPCTKPMVHILADHLSAKGFVSVEQMTEPVPYKRITALVSEEEYASAEAIGLVDRLFHGSWKKLVVSLAGNGGITGEDIREIGQIIEEMETAKK